MFFGMFLVTWLLSQLLKHVSKLGANHLTMKVLFCFSWQQPSEKKPEASQTGIAKLEGLP